MVKVENERNLMAVSNDDIDYQGASELLGNKVVVMVKVAAMGSSKLPGNKGKEDDWREYCVGHHDLQIGRIYPESRR